VSGAGPERFAPARAVADALLYEGYLPYPYRASATKNRHRFQWGVLAPRTGRAAAGERSTCTTECLVVPGPAATLHVQVRCLQLQHRAVEQALGMGEFAPVDELTVGGTRWVPWDEAVEHEITVAGIRVAQGSTSRTRAFTLPASVAAGDLRDASGRLAGRVVRRTAQVDGRVEVDVEPAGGLSDPATPARVRVSVANTTAERDGRDRDRLLHRSLVAAHVVLAIDGGVFCSVLDPPAATRAAAAVCTQDGLFPVLVGDDDALVLASPIILYDHPAVAPESPGDLFDATEIDEILALRVLTLTDEEKAEARATDPRAAAIVDRCDAMPPEAWARLHGTMRAVPQGAEPDPGAPWWDPAVDASVDPGTDAVIVAGVPVRAGSRVRLVPSRRADAHDLFLAGMTATVTGVFHDVDGAQHVAVMPDAHGSSGDPESFAWPHRSLFFHPDEVVPLGGPAGSAGEVVAP
jgi:hypothetical protein